MRARKRYFLPVFPRFFFARRKGGRKAGGGGFMIYCGFCEFLLPVVVMTGPYDKTCAPETGNGVGIG